MSNGGRKRALLRLGTMLLVGVAAAAFMCGCGADSRLPATSAAGGQSPTHASSAAGQPTSAAPAMTATPAARQPGDVGQPAIVDEPTPTSSDVPPDGESTASPAPKPAQTPAPGHFPPGTGDAAPDFTLPAATGGEITLSQFRGDRPIVLVFYRAFW